MMIILRVVGGIRQHFGIRVTEWIMTCALFGWSLVLALDSDTFETSRAFVVIARYGDEAVWGNICFLAGMLRLAALIVNGTFRAFRFSPHLRAIASIVACVFWGQIALGVLMAYATSGAGGTGVIAYSTFMTIEMWNLFRAWADVGATRKA